MQPRGVADERRAAHFAFEWTFSPKSLISHCLDPEEVAYVEHRAGNLNACSGVADSPVRPLLNNARRRAMKAWLVMPKKARLCLTLTDVQKIIAGFIKGSRRGSRAVKGSRL